MNVRPTRSPRSFIVIGLFLVILAVMAFVLYDQLQPVYRAFSVNPGANPALQTLNNGGWRWAVTGVLALIALLLLAIGMRYRAIENTMRHAPRTMTDQELTEVLHTTLHFEEADLQANRLGQVTDGQRAYLKVRTRSGTAAGMYTVIIVVAVTAIIAGVYFWINQNGENPISPDMFPIVLVVFAASIGLVIIFSLISALRSRSAPDKAIRVREAEGEVHIIMRQMGTLYRTTYTQVHVGRKRLIVAPDQVPAFWNGARYHVYYMKTWSLCTVLSAELLD